ncbi:MAG: hypothetical protein KA285_08680 [Bacteroidia bacterium]|nr:hypothetical protein [Bacteroidia bacterium]
MSRSIIQPEKIVTEISGVVSKGMQAFGMQALIVQNEDPALVFRYFVRAGTEVDEGALVKEGDVLGQPGDFPEMLMIGSANYTFPKTFQISSEGVIKVEGVFFGSDGNFYIARRCSIAILKVDESLELGMGLESELIEEGLYSTDQSVIAGKTVSNVTSQYGIREEEILEEEKDLPLLDWLEKKRNLGELFFWCPYEQLLWMEVEMNNLIDVLEQRMFLRS